MKRTLVGAVAVLAIILGIVAYASAAVGTVDVTARVNSKLTLALSSDTTITLAPIDPDATGGVSAVGPTATVRSNRTYAFTPDWATNPSNAFSDDYTHATTAARTTGVGVPYAGNVTFTPSWDLGPGDVVGTLRFTAIQVP
jgi:hypothetical protein